MNRHYSNKITEVIPTVGHTAIHTSAKYYLGTKVIHFKECLNQESGERVTVGIYKHICISFWVNSLFSF
jgi:hypothetical protein